MIYYFSATGNSRWAALTLSSLLGDTAIHITQALPLPDRPEGSLGLVFPTYGWDVPPIMKTFIQALRAKSGWNYIYFLTTCGDDTGCLTQRLAQCLRPLTLDAGWALIMPESYVALPGFDVDTPEKQQAKIEAAHEKIQTIAALIRNHARLTFDTHPGPLPRTKTYLLGSLFRAFCFSPRGFHVDAQRCIGCRACQTHCPTGTIEMLAGRPHWNPDKPCTMCLACYHHCPHHAINYRSFTRRKGQYLYPSKQAPQL